MAANHPRRALVKRRLTAGRVEVLRVLLAKGPIEDPSGHAVGDAEVDALRERLAVTEAELARVRLQLQMFRAWAGRMPDLAIAEERSERPLTVRPDGAFPGPDRTAKITSTVGRCEHVYPDGFSDTWRRELRCGLPVWGESEQWCWHHDPATTALRRAAVRRELAVP